MAESHESAKTHDGVGHTSRHLVDDEVVDLTNVLAGRSVDLSTLDVFARNAFVVGMGGGACQVISLLMTFAFSIQLRCGCSKRVGRTGPTSR